MLCNNCFNYGAFRTSLINCELGYSRSYVYIEKLTRSSLRFRIIYINQRRILEFYRTPANTNGYIKEIIPGYVQHNILLNIEEMDDILKVLDEGYNKQLSMGRKLYSTTNRIKLIIKLFKIKIKEKITTLRK